MWRGKMHDVTSAQSHHGLSRRLLTTALTAVPAVTMDMTNNVTKRRSSCRVAWKRLAILAVLLLLTSTRPLFVDAKQPRKKSAHDKKKRHFKKLKRVLKRVTRGLKRRVSHSVRLVQKGVGSIGRTAAPPELFPKGASVARLGKRKFPDKSSKHVWLVIFYSNISQACQQVKPRLESLASSATKFKVGSVDCLRNTREARFCQKLGVDMQSLPHFATVIDGKVKLLSDKDYRFAPFEWVSTEALHDLVIRQIPKMHILNHLSQIKERLLSSDKPAVLLLTDKYDTSPLYVNIAHKYRLQFVFCESRASNQVMAKEFDVKTYPHLMVILPTNTTTPVGEPWGEYTVVKYNGSNKGRNIQMWLDKMAKTAKAQARAAERERRYSDIPVKVFKYARQENHDFVQVANNRSSWEEASNHSHSYAS